MTPDHQELLEFLYRSPIALVTASLEGSVQSITPLACQWLLPISPNGELDNLYAILQDVVPDLPARVHNRSSGVICNGVVLHLDAGSPRDRHLSLTVQLFSNSSIAAIFTDVSSEHRQIDYAQQGLRTLRNTLQTSPIAVGITRIEDQEVVFFNRAYADLVQSHSTDAPTPDPRNSHKDPDWFEKIRVRLETEEFILNQLVELNPQASAPHKPLWALASYMLIDYEGEKSILAWLYDVTDLQQAKQASEEASHAKGQFLATMSHEIRTPMNAILGMLKLIEGTALSPRQSDYIQKASGAARSLLGLLDDVLDFSKVDAGKMELERQPFRLETLLRELSVLLSPGPKQTIEVLFDVAPDLPEVVVGDLHRLRQILINLGGNAVKFTEHGQVLIGVSLVQRDAHQATIKFKVADSGIGITTAQQQRIFAGFSQAEASTTRRYGGTGLGLAISKSLVELMGGTLKLASIEGQGSAFSFAIDFPLDPSGSDWVPDVPAPTIAPQRVLIVDDNPVARTLLSGMVQNLGWECESAPDAPHALAMLSAAASANTGKPPYSLLLINWQMPQTDGWALCQQIQSALAGTSSAAPRIILTSDNGRHDLSQRSDEEQARIDGLLVKPFTQAMLADAIADLHNEKFRVRQTSSPRASKRQLLGMRILVVEDNQINQQIAEELLSAEGAIVSLAANGALGVEAVDKAAPQFDVVLMDIQMPVMDGYTAAYAIRDDLGLAKLPIIAMTANAMASDREACLAAGMNDHIGKPFDLARLISLLIRVTGITPVANLDAEPPLPLQAAAGLAVPGVDMEVALARMGGAQSLYLRTAHDFLKMLEPAPSEFQALLRTEDWHSLRRCLHTLKGNAATLGLQELAREAGKVERLCVNPPNAAGLVQPLQSLEAHLQRAAVCLQQAVTILQSKPGAAATESNPRQDAHIVAEALTALEQLLAASDMEALSKFAEVRDTLVQLPDGLGDRLEAAMQALDLEEARIVCLAALAAV